MVTGHSDIRIAIAEAKRHELLASLCENGKMRDDHIQVANALRNVAEAAMRNEVPATGRGKRTWKTTYAQSP
jgi:hypothetical protein